jgi:serine/threonine protein kinase
LDHEDSCKIEISYFPVKYIGKGAFGEVLLVKNIKTENYYAMKIIRKTLFQKKKHYEHLNTETEILTKTNHPFIIKMHKWFQSRNKVFFVMDFANGGSIKYHMDKKRKFHELEVQFYAAEIILALEYLHEMGYIYRDLKMENVLLDSEGHVKLVDFGVSKRLSKNEDDVDEDKANTFWGTMEYLAPEVKSRERYDKSVDFWSLGVLLHTMLYGKLPQIKSSEIEKGEQDLSFGGAIKTINSWRSSVSTCSPADDLFSQLLEVNPAYRLGSKNEDIQRIKDHDFFSDIDWDLLLSKELDPPFVPDLAHDHDTSYIDRKLTTQSFDVGVCQTIGCD